MEVWAGIDDIVHGAVKSIAGDYNVLFILNIMRTALLCAYFTPWMTNSVFFRRKQ